MIQSDPKRYNQYMTKAHREKIHRESKVADSKDLSFTFSKPKKQKPNRDAYQCGRCERIIPIDASRTHAIVCRCGNFMIINKDEINVIG